MPLSGLNFRPVKFDPQPKRSEWFIESPTNIGDLVEGRRFYAFRIEMATYQSVAFGPSQRLGENLERNPIQCLVNILIATALVRKLGQHSKGPPTADQSNELLR